MFSACAPHDHFVRNVLAKAGYFIKFYKIWLFMTSAAPPREASIWGEGQPDGVDSVQDGVKGEAGCGGNAVRASGLIKGLRGLVWFRSRLEDDESLAVFGAGSAVGSGAGSGWGT